jgi:excisionase family DNA binding protein
MIKVQQNRSTMMNPPSKQSQVLAQKSPDEGITTHQAAKLLGVSVGTVLNMVERGQLLAWRTAGGHRRVIKDSVVGYLAMQEECFEAQPVRQMRVLVLEDEDFIRAAYQDQFEAWKLPLDIQLSASGVEAMLAVGRSPPDILLIDLSMPEIDGFAVVRTLREGTRYANMDIVVVTGMNDDQIAAAGGLPVDVLVWHKPIPFPRLRGYLDAHLSMFSRRSKA